MNRTVAAMSTPPSRRGEKNDPPDIAALKRSTTYVSGEQEARARESPCIWESGMNIPDMKMSGKRIRFEKIITFGGLLEAGEASRAPREEHAIVPSTKVNRNRAGLMICIGMNRVLTIQMIREMPRPKIAPARTSPKMMLCRPC